ncbi:hypothetical protein M9Y10_041910 [Tritrichomonas musculus]|uniref:Chorein N-terminal domain-containing protein n=1 Tax=Tritrichomonas musculus TaxID=1915356 RepID=A0ABR2K5P3_9EUKA
MLTAIVSHFLKEYLKPLEPGQIDLDVIQGTLKLNNIQLLPTALTVRHIPFIIKKGCVKFAKVVFPWNNLKNAACDILIEDIFVALQFESNIIIKSDIQADQKSIHVKSEPNTVSRDEQVKIVQGLFESVIDNLRVQIKNVHLRIEFPCDPKPIVIGIYTPEILFNTVDEKGNTITTIQHPKYVRKQFTIKDFSIYFDTDSQLMEIKDDSQFQSQSQSIQYFVDLMMAKMNEDHQYIFSPTVFKSVLIHTKDKTQKITNQVQTRIDKIQLNLDLPQCRSIIRLNYLWSQFTKRRKYANCMRPPTLNKPSEVWQYAHRCAVLKNKPHIFKPYLALTILKARIKYVELFKQAKVSKLSASLWGSPKQKLVALEKKVGPTASIYLREYSEAIYVKEESMKDTPDMTAFDISQLKSVFESTEFVFSMRQFAATIEIESFGLHLLYDRNSPLISLSCDKFTGGFNTVENVVNMSINIMDASVVSFVNDKPKKLFQKIPHPIDNLSIDNIIVLSMAVPINDVVTSFDCVVAPIKMTVDTETIGCIFDFLNIHSQNNVNSDNGTTSRFEIGELLQYLKGLVNYKMSFKISLVQYEFPFQCQNDEIKYLTFELANLNFHKNIKDIVHKNMPQLPMYFAGYLNLKAKIDAFTFFTTEDINATIVLLYEKGKLSVQIDSKVDFSTFQLFIPKSGSTAISFALSNLLELPLLQSGVKLNTPPTHEMIVGRSKIKFDVSLKALNIFLTDENPENDLKISIFGLNGIVEYYLISFNYSWTLDGFKMIQYNKPFIELLDKVKFSFGQATGSNQLTVDANISNPHICLDFKSIHWLLNFADQFQKIVPQKEQIQLNEQNDESAPKNHSSNIKLIRSEETFFSEARLKLKREFTPSSMIFTESLLTQSIDDFLQGSSSFEKHVLVHKEEEETHDDDSDSNQDDAILVPKEEEKSNSLNISLQVTGIWMEMIDYGPKKSNSNFTIKSLKIIDFTSEGYKLAFEEFYIKRECRTIFFIPTFVVPISNISSDFIDIVVDYAEAHIYSGDIIALTYDSPKIFNMMFGGPNPMFKNKLVVNALCKKGTGSLRYENNEQIIIVHVENPSARMTFDARKLDVDANLPVCNGYYKDDNQHFLSIYENFHAHYIGTLNDQSILIDVPKARLSLKYLYFDWLMILEPLTHVDKSKLLPLRIQINVQPSKLDFLSEKTVLNSNEFNFLASKTSEMFNFNQDEKFANKFTFEFEKSNCTAIRDKNLRINVKMSAFNIRADTFDLPLFGTKNIELKMNEKLITLIVPSLKVNFPVSIFSQVINDIPLFIPFDLLPPLSSIKDLYLPNVGIDLLMNDFSMAFFPSQKVSLKLKIPSMKFLFNSSHNIAGLNIDSINVLTISDSDKPTLIVNLSEIQSLLTFTEKNKNELSKLTLESIQKLPQEESVKQPLKCFYFYYKMSLIQINYTHFFAKTLISCVFKTMFNFKSLPAIPNISLETLSKIKVHLDCSIERMQINFVVFINPFASVTLTGIKLNYDDKWSASINDFTLLPVTEEEAKSDLKSFIIKKGDDDFISITIQDGQLFSILSEFELNVDFKLLFTIVQFMMASPFLQINPIMAAIKKSKNPNEIQKAMNFASFSKSLPFDLILHMKKTRIYVPIETSDNDTNRELQIHISALASITSSNLDINLSSLSINFYDIDTKTVYPNILTDFTFDCSVIVEEDSSLALKLNMLDVNLVFSASDIYYIILLARSIEKVINSQIFTFEENNFDIFKLRILSFELISANMNIVLCKNTKLYSQVVPIFRCIIPPIMFKVQKAASNQVTQTPVVINIKPYLEYFNIVTGNFDLIIEPTSMHIFAYIIDEQMTFGVNILDNLNINFPLSAIINLKDLIGEIKESLKKQKAIKYENLPSMWLCNKLGSTVTFTVNNEKHELEHDKFVPLFGVPLNASISFNIDENNYSIEPNSFNYPTYMSRTILVVKKPYKGGMLISFERTYQIENNLSFPIDLYASENSYSQYKYITTIEPHERQPFIFDKEIYVSIILKGQTKSINHNSMKLYLLDKSLSVFTIRKDDNKIVQCVKTVYNDTNIAARIISISSQYLIYNLLPKTLYYKSDNDVVTSVERGETTDFYYVQNDTILAFLSFNEKNFLKKKSHLKIDIKNTNAISIYNDEDNTKQKCLAECSFEKENNQTTIILYMPVVIFNMTLFILDFEVCNTKNKMKNEFNNNYKNHLETLPKSHHYWCPHSLIDNSDESSLMVTVFANGNSKTSSQPFDCLTTGCETLFLPSLNNPNRYLPLRCNISNQSRTSILTISPLIKMANNLDFDFFLTPIEELPQEAKEIKFIEEKEEENETSKKFCFTKNSELSLPFIPKNGTFTFSMEGFSTSPSLSLLEPQKTVFKVQNKTEYRLIELQVIDLETGIRIEFNKVVFPTPVLINNQLDVQINAYQLVHSIPFEICSHSTSIFAFDEPFVFPSVTLSFGEENTYLISLAQDTEKIEMRKKFNGSTVYVQVKHNKYGNRLITISQQKDEPPEKYKYIFQSSFNGVAMSLIDYQMRETTLIYLSKLETKFTLNSEYLAVNVTLKSIQVDDQNPLAPHPTVIYGYFNNIKPYLSFNCLCPINSNSFTSFDYFTINLQRIDADIDSSFVSDWLNYLTSLHLKAIHSVKPKKPTKSNSNDLIALRYFEITPSLFILRYNRKTKRPPMLGKVPRFLRFIPSISPKRMVLPGIFLSRITDRVNSIQASLIDDYKTAAFNAILGMLGSGGKIIKVLGIASAIASSLNIKMTSDLNGKVSLNSFSSSENLLDLSKQSVEAEFDNQTDDEISSCFSYKSLSSVIKKINDNSLETSPLIQFTMPKFQAINEEGMKIVHSNDSKVEIKRKLMNLQKEKNDVIQRAGLELKIIPGIGYGRGIAGVLTKELNDPLNDIEPMSHSQRIRETRAIPGAQISVFNPAIAFAQKKIFMSGGLNEKAREFSVSTVGGNRSFIIMTENTLYVFSGDLSNITESVKFADILKVRIDDEKNEVTLKLKNGKTVVVVIDSKVSINFMLSILRMNHRYEESLLL